MSPPSSSPSPRSPLGIPSASVPLLSAIVGGVLVLLFFADYFRRKRSEVASIAPHLPPDPNPSATSISKSSQSAVRKPHARSHARSHAADKDQAKRHHHLDVNTLKGHADAVTALCFSSDGRNLATVCGDGVVRIFRVDDATSKSFKLLRLNLPAGVHPTAVAFTEGDFGVVVAAQTLSGSSLYMYADVSAKAAAHQGKIPAPEIKWKHDKVHERRSVINLSGTAATYGNADGSTILVSCSEGTDIKIWHGKSGKELGSVDTNQLKNNMATVSPNGRFLAAAAFTADVKVWEIVYSKDGSVKEILKVMQLKGHKSAVTSLCFSPSSEQIITASKDGSIRVWNIDVRYHLDEDPKTMRVLQIPLHDAKGSALQYDHLSISPDGKILAAVSGSTLQWLCPKSGKVLDAADKAHEGDITGVAWTPSFIPVGGRSSFILATAGTDKKVKFWSIPEVDSS